jgi:hypothetical protein
LTPSGPFECFLSVIDSWENLKEPWQKTACRDALARLEFVSATRKMFQPPTPKDGTGPDPKLKAMFDMFLTRNREICPLAEFTSTQARVLWQFENLEIENSIVDMGHVLTGIEGGRRQKPSSTYPSLVVRDANTESIVTWAGDLGSAMVQYGVAKVTGKRADLSNYLRQLAAPHDLLGDIDGMNLAAIYDESLSLADNLRRYYHARPFRRFHSFLSSAQDDTGNPLFNLGGSNPPTIDNASRQHAAGKIALYARAWLYKNLSKWSASQLSDLYRICNEYSSEMNVVVSYFILFLENGLGTER